MRSSSGKPTGPVLDVECPPPALVPPTHDRLYTWAVVLRNGKIIREYDENNERVRVSPLFADPYVEYVHLWPALRGPFPVLRFHIPTGATWELVTQVTQRVGAADATRLDLFRLKHPTGQVQTFELHCGGVFSIY